MFFKFFTNLRLFHFCHIIYLFWLTLSVQGDTEGKLSIFQTLLYLPPTACATGGRNAFPIIRHAAVFFSPKVHVSGKPCTRAIIPLVKRGIPSKPAPAHISIQVNGFCTISPPPRSSSTICRLRPPGASAAAVCSQGGPLPAAFQNPGGLLLQAHPYFASRGAVHI